MSIREITIDELRRMNGKEALIIQGCGAPLQEWQDGINDRRQAQHNRYDRHR